MRFVVQCSNGTAGGTVNFYSHESNFSPLIYHAPSPVPPPAPPPYYYPPPPAPYGYYYGAPPPAPAPPGGLSAAAPGLLNSATDGVDPGARQKMIEWVLNPPRSSSDLPPSLLIINGMFWRPEHMTPRLYGALRYLEALQAEKERMHRRW
eukprot:tig00000492_g1403.t1